jgi:methionyl-tRNA formyltransferase
MKILFLSKKTDWCNKAKDYVLKNFDDVKVFQGNWVDKLPEKIKNWDGDFIISYLSPWVIPEHTLKSVKKAINFHPGTPKYGGIGCYNFAIYNEEKEYGVLCHEMEKKIDSGKIIKVKMFPISDRETVMSLKEKSMKKLLELFYDIIDLIKKEEELPISDKQWEKKPYTRKELQDLCRITLDMPEKEKLKRIRATYYPGGPDYPYIETDDGDKIIIKEIPPDGLENTTV